MLYQLSYITLVGAKHSTQRLFILLSPPSMPGDILLLQGQGLFDLREPAREDEAQHFCAADV